MCTIFDQKQIVLIAKFPEALNFTRKPKIMHCQDASCFTIDFRLQVCPVRPAVSPNCVKGNFRSICLDGFDCCCTKIGWNQDLFSRLHTKSSQAMENRVSCPEELEVGRILRSARNCTKR